MYLLNSRSSFNNLFFIFFFFFFGGGQQGKLGIRNLTDIDLFYVGISDSDKLKW